LLPSPRAATSPPGDGLTVDVTRFIQGLDERHDLGGKALAIEGEAEPDLGVKGKGLFPHRSIPQSPPQWGAPPLTGTPAQIADDIKRYAEVGVRHMMFPMVVRRPGVTVQQSLERMEPRVK
jgi:alkanesulfonate monooxygenase SsuD/methylene tetrahydromethanopterin reductase-like flavin-dependent oxidoreductase (luciferase family)